MTMLPAVVPQVFEFETLKNHWDVWALLSLTAQIRLYKDVGLI